jgi:hypothetical protein
LKSAIELMPGPGTGSGFAAPQLRLAGAARGRPALRFGAAGGLGPRRRILAGAGLGLRWTLFTLGLLTLRLFAAATPVGSLRGGSGREDGKAGGNGQGQQQMM